MIATFPAVVHAVAGSPAMSACVPMTGRCWFCGGEHARGQLVEDWVSVGFTTGNRVRCAWSTTVCEACVFVCSRLSPVPGRPPKDGKSLGGNFRNYTHCAQMLPGGGVEYFNATKADPDRVTAWLRSPKLGTWWCAVAESGQKHVIPWAPPNGPGVRGQVAFDDATVAIPDGQRWAMLDDVEALLLAGVTRASIVDGRWSVEQIRRHRSALIAFDEAWGHERGGGWFALVCHLAKNRREKSEWPPDSKQ